MQYLLLLPVADWNPFCALPRKQLSAGWIIYVDCLGHKNRLVIGNAWTLLVL